MESSPIEVHQANDMSEISMVEQLCSDVVLSIKEMMEQLPPLNIECSIYRVPKLLRKMNDAAYTPQVISIGPFHHHSQKDLIATEQYKLRHCINFLSRLDDQMNSLEFCVKTNRPLVEQARNYYAESINLSDKDFVKMMLVDSCFVVEFIILSYNKCHPRSFSQNNSDHSFYQTHHEIYADLIKVENQVPFFLLQHLFNLIPQNDTSISFMTLTQEFLRYGFVEDYSLPSAFPKPINHFVDLLRFYFVNPMISPSSNNDSIGMINPPSITELCEAGVTIKKAEDVEHVMNISFKNGVLEIPPLHIYDSFESMMRNLIAFEHFPRRNNSKCIQYIVFMDGLISTEKDVDLLMKAEIIVNNIGGSAKEVSKLFNNLGKFVEFPSDFCFNGINNALNEYCRRRWNKAKASLKHNYFNTPWAIVSFFAATFLIVLTLLQTIFSGKSAFPN